MSKNRLVVLAASDEIRSVANLATCGLIFVYLILVTSLLINILLTLLVERTGAECTLSQYSTVHSIFYPVLL